MFKYIFSAFLLLLLLSSFVVREEAMAPPILDECSIENTSFLAGEKLVFKAYYNWQFIWIPAGESEFSVKETKTDYEIKIVAKTYSTYDDFFRVRDYFYSKIDKQTMFPKNFVRIVQEGNYVKYDSVSFDQVNRKAYSYNGKSRHVAVRKVENFDQCMHDLVSIFYYLRNLKVDNYKKGTILPMKLFIDEQTYAIKVRYEGKEAKKNIKELGTFNTVKVVPDLLVGEVFKEGDKMKIWVTDDENKIPLIVESPLKIGSAKVILKSYSGLRHPLTAKVK
jgi:hypothetical protein